MEDEGHGSDDEQKMQGKRGNVKKQKSADPKQDKNHRERNNDARG